jgi:acyl-CoA reductase-like NAD-dependent aldehyde dehydrogenase
MTRARMQIRFSRACRSRNSCIPI